MTAPYGMLRNEALPEVESALQRYAGIGQFRYLSAPTQPLYAGQSQSVSPLFSRRIGRSIDDEVGLPIGLTPLSSEKGFYDFLGRDRTVMYS